MNCSVARLDERRDQGVDLAFEFRKPLALRAHMRIQPQSEAKESDSDTDDRPRFRRHGSSGGSSSRRRQRSVP